MLWSSDPLVISQILAWLRSAPAAAGSGSQGLGKLASARGDVLQGMHRAPLGSSPLRWRGGGGGGGEFLIILHLRCFLEY